MAGRGRRLGSISDTSKTVGGTSEESSISPLTKKISEISGADSDSNLLKSIHTLFKEFCTSKETLKDVLLNLHSKALSDSGFGEKLVIALEQLSDFKVDNVIVRGELLSHIQEDYKLKDEMSESDKVKFINAVNLLSSVYNRIKVCGVPIMILGVALLEYFDLLLKGEEQELRALAVQIFINGKTLSTTKDLSAKYELLKHNLRNTLVTRKLSNISKCWILLSLDLMSNDIKLPTGGVKDFYLTHLGEDYRKFETPTQLLLEPFSISINYQKSVKSSHSPKHRNSDGRKSDHKDDFSNTFSNLELNKSDGDSPGRRGKLQSSQRRRENQKWQNDEATSDCDKAWGKSKKENSSSGHDDRFDKEENFYGIQLPRRTKSVSENQNKEK